MAIHGLHLLSTAICISSPTFFKQRLRGPNCARYNLSVLIVFSVQISIFFTVRNKLQGFLSYLGTQRPNNPVIILTCPILVNPESNVQTCIKRGQRDRLIQAKADFANIEFCREKDQWTAFYSRPDISARHARSRGQSSILLN